MIKSQFLNFKIWINTFLKYINGKWRKMGKKYKLKFKILKIKDQKKNL